MAVYSYVPTEGAYGHGIATLDNDKGIESFDYIALGEYNGKQYIYSAQDPIPTQPDDISFKKVSKCPSVFIEEWRTKRKAELDKITLNLSAYKVLDKSMYLTSSLGFKIDADISSQKNLEGLILIGQPTDKFKDYDNNYQSVTVEGFNTLLKECAINGAALYSRRFEYIDALEAATTLDEIMEMSFDFPMMDFSSSEVAE